MRVRARPHRQVVFACKPKRLVVVRIEEETGVVDLENVDVGEVTLKRRRVGDRVHAVEGMRKVDEAALLLDRRHRVDERQAAWNLLAQEQTDHLSLSLRLHLLGGDHDEVVVGCECHRLERAPEHVVVRDGDGAEADRHGVHDQVGGVDRAIV